MYSSSEPCPMCLVACYRAWIWRLVYAANSQDVGTNGFEDLHFYRELTLPNKERTLLAEVPVGGDLRENAAGALAEWEASSVHDGAQALTVRMFVVTPLARLPRALTVICGTEPSLRPGGRRRELSFRSSLPSRLWPPSTASALAGAADGDGCGDEAGAGASAVRSSFRLCYLRGPAGIIVALAEQIGRRGPATGGTSAMSHSSSFPSCSGSARRAPTR